MEPSREPLRPSPQDVSGRITNLDLNPVPPEARGIDPNSPFALKPTRPDQKPHFDAVSEACENLYKVILQHVPSCSDRTIAIRNLQEVRMWSNAAIVHDGSSYTPSFER